MQSLTRTSILISWLAMMATPLSGMERPKRKSASQAQRTSSLSSLRAKKQKVSEHKVPASQENYLQNIANDNNPVAKTPIELALEHRRTEAIKMLLPKSFRFLDGLCDPAGSVNALREDVNQQRTAQVCKLIIESDNEIAQSIVSYFLDPHLWFFRYLWSARYPAKKLPSKEAHKREPHPLIQYCCQNPQGLRILLQVTTVDSKIEGQTPLIIAAHLGNRECVQILLDEYHARVYCKDPEGKTAFDYATPEIRKVLQETQERRDKQVERFLKECETTDHPTPICINTCDSNGTSLLSNAVKTHNATAVRLLLHQEADLTVKDQMDHTALSYAASLGFTDMVELLLTRWLNLTPGNLIHASSWAAYAVQRETITQLLTFAPDLQTRRSIFARCFETALKFQKELVVNHLLTQYATFLQDYYTGNIRRTNKTRIYPLVHCCSLSRNVRMVERVLEALDTVQWEQNDPRLTAHRAHDLHEALVWSVKNGRLDIFSMLLRKKSDRFLDKLFSNTFEKELAKIDEAPSSTLSDRHLVEGSRADRNDICFFAKHLSAIADKFAEIFIQRKSSFGSAASEEQKKEALAKLLSLEVHVADKKVRIGRVLRVACMLGRIDILNILLRLGLPRAYINAQDGLGRTALMLALTYGNFECALKLFHDPVMDKDGHQVRDADGNEVYINHCGQRGLWLYDKEHNAALYYAAQAAIYDVPAAGLLREGSSATYDIPSVIQLTGLAITTRLTPVTKIYYSLSQGAFKVFNELLRAGAKIVSKDPIMIGRLLQDLIAENNIAMALRILGLSSQTVKKSPAGIGIGALNK